MGKDAVKVFIFLFSCPEVVMLLGTDHCYRSLPLLLFRYLVEPHLDQRKKNLPEVRIAGNYNLEAVDLAQGSPNLFLESYRPVGFRSVVTNLVQLINQLFIQIRCDRLRLE
jgi:hypothetical protein